MVHPHWRGRIPAKAVLAPERDSSGGGCCCRIQIHATKVSRTTESIHFFVFEPILQNPA